MLKLRHLALAATLATATETASAQQAPEFLRIDNNDFAETSTKSFQLSLEEIEKKTLHSLNKIGDEHGDWLIEVSNGRFRIIEGKTETSSIFNVLEQTGLNYFKNTPCKVISLRVEKAVMTGESVAKADCLEQS